MDSATFMYGDKFYDDVGFCIVHDIIMKHSHSLLTLQVSNNTVRNNWIERNVEIKDIETMKEFCRRAERMWKSKLWSTED
jgi:hypothetical protein